MLSRLALMVQAALLDGEFFDLLPTFDDGGVPTEVDDGGRDVAESFVTALVVVVLNESPIRPSLRMDYGQIEPSLRSQF
jgi:hypothetical protein